MGFFTDLIGSDSIKLNYFEIFATKIVRYPAIAP